MHYFKLYSDTGIWSEAMILSEYEEKFSILIDTIIDLLTSKMSSEILPYEILPSGLRKSVFTIENRRLKVTYTEHEDERIIEDIQIQYRK